MKDVDQRNEAESLDSVIDFGFSVSLEEPGAQFLVTGRFLMRNNVFAVLNGEGSVCYHGVEEKILVCVDSGRGNFVRTAGVFWLSIMG